MKRLGLIFLPFVLAGCTATASTPVPGPTVTVTVTQDPTDPLAPDGGEKIPTEAPTTDGGQLKLGKTFKTTYATITVQEFDKSVKLYDSTIQTVLIKSCVTKIPKGEKGVSFSWYPWELVDDDDGRYEPASSRQDGLGPAYPDDEDLLKVGACVKGLIQFDSVGKAKIELVRYRNDAGETAEWRVG